MFKELHRMRRTRVICSIEPIERALLGEFWLVRSSSVRGPVKFREANGSPREGFPKLLIRRWYLGDLLLVQLVLVRLQPTKKERWKQNKSNRLY